MIGIYKITNKLNNKFYVGQSKHIEQRKKEHLRRSSNSIISKAMKKYGKENFTFEILEICTIEQLNEKELKWINKLKPQYNIKGGGDSIHYLNKKTRNKISKTLKEKHKNGTLRYPKELVLSSKTRKRKPRTEECKKKLRLANLGKKHSEEIKRKIGNANKKSMLGNTNGIYNGTKIKCLNDNKKFNKVKDAAEYYGIHISTIQRSLKDPNKNSKYKFIYI